MSVEREFAELLAALDGLGDAKRRTWSLLLAFPDEQTHGALIPRMREIDMAMDAMRASCESIASRLGMAPQSARVYQFPGRGGAA